MIATAASGTIEAGNRAAQFARIRSGDGAGVGGLDPFFAKLTFPSLRRILFTARQQVLVGGLAGGQHDR
jgi:hypothetical protein